MTRRPLTTAAALALGLAFAGCAHGQAVVGTTHLNQAGFETAGRKGATLVDASTTPLPWRVLDGSGAVVAQGTTTVFGDEPAAGAHVHTVRFDALPAGEGYRLVAGEHQSRPFKVVARPFEGLKADALAYFYENRSGVPILAEHVARPDLARPAGHAPEVVTCFKGADQRGNVWPGCGYRLDASRGWYDAGDHGKYVVNGGISVWTLVNAWERAQARGGAAAAALADGTADIPEAGNGVPDILDEARWELEFLLAMQIPDGQRATVPAGPLPAPGQPLVLTEIDAGGMAHHKLHDASWTPLPTAPHEDAQVRSLYPPSTGATLNLAATAAQCARVWRDIDPAFATRCESAARRAMAAALANPRVFAPNTFDGGGGYGDDDLTDEFYWAAAELYAATGEAQWLDQLRASPLYLGAPGSGANSTGDIAWPQVGALGTITLATAAPALPEADRARARQALIGAARAYAAEAAAHGYGLPFDGERTVWGSNGDLMNRAMILGLAHDFTGERAYRDAVVAALDYLLGRNPLDQSFISGWGARPMLNPHHRFWAHSADPAYPAPPAGALSGGPNNSNMSDPVAQKLRGKCAALTCWSDHIESFALNEVAINWNAPLVWVAAWVDEPAR